MRLGLEGLSTRAWTINAGVSSGLFDNLAAGGTPREGELPKVLAVVGMTLAEFEGRRRTTAQPAQAALPTLRVMPRAAKLAAEAAPAEAPSQAASEEPMPATAASGLADATEEALERWLEARRQAFAAGLETEGPDGIRLVTDLARLACDIGPGHRPVDSRPF